MSSKSRKVHVLDDNRLPEGPLLCGKTSRQVLGGELAKGDVLCRGCAAGLMARNNEYAGRIDVLSEFHDDNATTIRELRLKLIRKDRTLVKLVERYLDAELEPV